VLEPLDVVDVQGIASTSVDGHHVGSRQRARPTIETIAGAGIRAAFGT
jgi:hypothetical protein